MERYTILSDRDSVLLRSVLYKLNYRFNTISLKIVRFFGSSWQVDCKLTWKCNEPRIAKTIQKKQFGWHIFQDLQSYSIGSVVC